MNKKEIGKKLKFLDINKKTIAAVLVVLAIFVAVLVFWGIRQSKKNSEQNFLLLSKSNDSQVDIQYYFGQECAHCKNVEKFISDNKLDDKISFSKKEIWHNTVNELEMQKKASECNLDPTKIGVPFIWARGKCYKGEIEVISFLKKEIGMQ